MEAFQRKIQDRIALHRATVPFGLDAGRCRTDGADIYLGEHRVEMLQLHVPKARQTHEILYMRIPKDRLLSPCESESESGSESWSDALFVTQLSESILIRIGLTKGRLDHTEIRYWAFGPKSKSKEQHVNGVYRGFCEPHSLSRSEHFKGCFYLSLQVPNVIYLMDAREWRLDTDFVRSVTIPPIRGGRYGTPHVVREDAQTGELWIGMKGNRGANPAGMRHKPCECCDDRVLATHYREFYEDSELSPPTSFCVCKVKEGYPDTDDASEVFPCENSPPMLDFLGDYVFVSQDQTDKLCRISRNSTISLQMPVNFPDAAASTSVPASTMTRNFTGPGLVTAPRGEVAWCALLGHQASMVRIEKSKEAENHTLQTYHFPSIRCQVKEEFREVRFIHFAFDSTVSPKPKMYILASSLLEPDVAGGNVADAVVVLEFKDLQWLDPIRLEVVPLPTQQSAAHRIAHVNINGRESLFVTEFTTSAIVQVFDPEKIPLRDLICTGTSQIKTFEFAPSQKNPPPVSGYSSGSVPTAATAIRGTALEEKCECGSVFVVDALFCQKCGKKREAIQTQVPLMETEASKQQLLIKQEHAREARAPAAPPAAPKLPASPPAPAAAGASLVPQPGAPAAPPAAPKLPASPPAPAAAGASSVPQPGDAPVNVAAYDVHADVVQALIDARVDIDEANTKGDSHLISAARHGQASIVERLLTTNANFEQTNHRGCTPLFIASQEGHAEVMLRLIKSRADIDRPNIGGATPLLMSAQNGRTSVVEHLLAATANVDTPDNQGTTPLKIAAQKGHIEVVQALITAHADVDRANNQGLTAIDELATWTTKWTTFGKALGATPLFISAMQGFAEVARQLIAAKAGVDKPTNRGDTALSMARSRGHQAVIDLLRSAGAQS